MGEIAEQMIEGWSCEGCGIPLYDAQGFPQRCAGCGGPRRTKEGRESNRRLALHHFDEAKQLAESKGLVLKRHTDQHYQLTDGKWLQNIYPGNQRLWYDRNRPKPGFIQLPRPWTLLDVVAASPCQSKGTT